MNFFTLVAIIVIYLSFENPTHYKEEKSVLFNKKALISLLKEINTERYTFILAFIIQSKLY